MDRQTDRHQAGGRAGRVDSVRHFRCACHSVIWARAEGRHQAWCMPLAWHGGWGRGDDDTQDMDRWTCVFSAREGHSTLHHPSYIAISINGGLALGVVERRVTVLFTSQQKKINHFRQKNTSHSRRVVCVLCAHAARVHGHGRGVCAWAQHTAVTSQLDDPIVRGASGSMYALHTVTETDACLRHKPQMFAFGATPASTLSLHGFHNAHENLHIRPAVHA